MKKALDSVNEKIFAALKRRAPEVVGAGDGQPPRLVAVSKLKPISSIIEAYECGQRYFGENYIQELETKSNSDEILSSCPDIKFHFIGHLQSNKVNKLLKVKNLHLVETIDSEKLANLIDKAIDRHKRESDEQLRFGDGQGRLESDQLRVLIQVNTSGEEQKNGVQPGEVIKLADHIVGQCQWLRLAGLMTIGKLDGWSDEPGPNKDFVRLYELRDALSRHLSIDPRELELSMGMSSDFEEAIELGSTNIRVGTMIFGERPPKSSV
uniref:Pyridoxal phosphate homeostasis protein n=1 Tax=Aceria tosichella TaxID=561515 RepID=A0A6G1SEE9_9ACAR